MSGNAVKRGDLFITPVINNQSSINKQHDKGKLTAWERIELVFDSGSFVPLFDCMEQRTSFIRNDGKRISGDGVIVGFGKISGNLVYIASEDFMAAGGTLGEAHAMKICRVMDLAYEAGAPILYIHDSGGARIEEGILSLGGYSSIFKKQVKLSGKCLQIAMVLGPCAGGACYGPALCDVILTVKKISHMFITGPKVVESVLGEKYSEDELGGAEIHARKSGVSHFCCDREADCFQVVKKILEFNFFRDIKPVRGSLHLPTFTARRRLSDLVPLNDKKAYDVKNVIENVCDPGTFLEFQEDFAENIVIGLARIGGVSVGIVANQPAKKAGVLDCDASVKAARFVRFLDCYRFPIITLVDVPAFMPGKKQEHEGIIRHGAKMLYAYAEAETIKISVILRKAYGGAYIAMDSLLLGADFSYAWPNAEIAVMGADGAVEIVYRKKLAEAEKREETKQKLIEEYETEFKNPTLAAKLGYVTQIIQPEKTREVIISSLVGAGDKKAREGIKHGNIPL